MRQYTTYAGLDVHARSIEASAVDVTTGEVHSRRFAGRSMDADLAGWLRSLPQPAYSAYESGCTGFGLARSLRAAGLDCDVIAVSTLPRSQKDRKQKCDRLDARAIRREITNPDPGYSVVRVPDERTEAARDLCRAHRVAVDDAKRAKQRLEMFLLRRGHVWDERTKAGRLRKPSGRAWEEWLDGISFGEPAAEEAFAAYRRQAREAAEEAARLAKRVRELAERPENKPYVDALSCLKGVDVGTAMLARAEFGDFARFESGRKVSCWLGTVPSDCSSGDSPRHGGITKAGDKYLRRGLVEGCSGIAAWKDRQKAPRRGAEVSAAAREIAARANRRLLGRYARLAVEGRKNANKARVAVVSELVRWIWVIGLQVQREQAGGAPAA